MGRPASDAADDVVEGFAERVAAAARPIDDVRAATAAYRRRGCEVLARARRPGGWALDDRHDKASRRSEGAAMLIRTKVNGEWREADVWDGSSLLALLRDGLRPPRLEERLRAGRMRIVFGLARR